MRKALIVAVVAAGALLGILVALLSRLDANEFRGRIQAELQNSLKRPVTLGEMGIGFFPLSIRVADVSIGESAGFPTGRPFATARQLRASVGLLPLLRKQVRVDSFVLRQPVVELVRGPAGKWNFSDLGGGGTGEKSGTAFAISSLEIEDGRVAVSNLADAKSRSVYDHIDLALKDFAPGKPMRVSAAMRPPGSAKGSLKLDAKGGAASVLSGQLEARDLSLAGFRQILGDRSGGNLDGILSGKADFESLKSVTRARGQFEVTDLRGHGAGFDETLRIGCDLSHDAASGALRIATLRLETGQSRVLISGDLNTDSSSLDARIRTAEASLADLLSLARVAGAGETSGKGALSLDARVRGPLKRPAELAYTGSGVLRNASVTLANLAKPLEVQTAGLRFENDTATLENLACSLGGSKLRGRLTVRGFSAPELGFALEVDRLDAGEFSQLTKPSKTAARHKKDARVPLTARGTLNVGTLRYDDLVMTQVRSECVFAGGVLTLDPLTAELFGGKQTGRLALDTRPQEPRLTLNTKMERVDADRLLSAATSVKKTLYGLLAAGGDANLSLVSGGNMARTLNGNLNLRLTEGRLAGMNLLNEMASLGKFLGYARSSEPFTKILQLAGDIRIRDGVANTDNLQLETDGGTVRMAGTVSLVDQSLDLRLTTVLNSNLSQKVGGSKVGGFLATVLANNQGELIIPARLSGTFDKPRFLPDPARVAEMKLKSLLPSGARESGAKEPTPARNLIDTIRSLRRK